MKLILIIFGALVADAFRVGRSSRAQKETFDRVANSLRATDLGAFITGIGHPVDTADRVEGIIDKWWPEDEADAETRMMKATQLLQMESRVAFMNAYHAAVNTSKITVDRETETTDCKQLWELSCKPHVEWAYTTGKSMNWAGEVYYELPQITGRTLGSASLEDWHKFFFCGGADEHQKCSAAPCGCSNPPCDECNKPDVVNDFRPDPGFDAQCHVYTYCVEKSGDCCPRVDGTRDPCCDYNPPRDPAAPPIFEHRAHIPGEELQKALHGGEFLGPLKETKCTWPSPLQTLGHQTLSSCASSCDRRSDCKAFSFKGSDCKLHSACKTQYAADPTVVFVKNVEKMRPDWLPDRKVSGTSGIFFVIGDWGSESCPDKASMHYVFPRIRPGDHRWEADHNAQRNVGNAMANLAKNLKPFQVVSAGDNFYWGGTFDKSLGGNDIHDFASFQRGFEQVYTDPALMVPWLGIMGNHDYGGDGCMANVRAQFDYTIKDMLHRNRWKMPSPYYSHRVDFEDFSAEYFMLDTNIEDAFTGRHGGICKQRICWEIHHRETVPYEKCKAWFSNLWQKQAEWFSRALAKSTADWKIVVLHHKPHGQIAGFLHPLVVKHGVQLMVGSHTHEMAFFDEWLNFGKPLLVVGAGGGAQANPGCGNGRYCSGTHQYGFAAVTMDKSHMNVTLHNQHGHAVFTRNVDRKGSAN